MGMLQGLYASQIWIAMAAGAAGLQAVMVAVPASDFVCMLLLSPYHLTQLHSDTTASPPGALLCHCCC
jgi:hypothetical protein